jgi:ABC-type transport system substrate-binding protein
MKPSPRLLAASAVLLAFAVASLAPAAHAAQAQKTLHLPMRAAGPGSLDPVTGSTVYDNRATSLFYETLLQYKYLARPLALEPLLLEEMPEMTVEDGEMRFRFKLKHGVMFHDDPCFPGGKGREMVTGDVFYSWKRLADREYEYENYWVIEATIKGLDAYKEAQAKRVEAGEKHDYDAPVEGFVEIDDHTFDVVLEQPIYSFPWKLAMFQLSIVPREAVEAYGKGFSRHPVGTGPFLLEQWTEKKDMTAVRNPTFRDERYPSEHEASDEEFGFHLAAGKRLPIVDRVEITMFVQENPMWLEFKSGKLDYTQVPAENFLEAFHKRSWKLKKEFADKGIVAHAVPLLDFIFRGFNMDDPILGGYTDKQRKLRQAIHLAMNHDEFNSVFYNDANVIYDGMIPPGLAGYPKDGKGPVSWLGHDVERAKELIAEAGYPGGKGLPVIDYYINSSGNSPEQAELFKRQLAEIGVQLNVRSLAFAQLIDAINKKKAPLFGFAWSSDYPDGENNLALFYGPNEAPGSNHYNYKNPEFDKLYEKIRVMPPSDERDALYEKMRDMVLLDTPYIGSMARVRFYLVNPWLKNFKPTEDFYNWIKYMDVDGAKRDL